MATFITDSDFELQVLQADKPVLVDFTASWCGPCQALAPVLDELAGERSDIKIVKVDVSDEKTNPVARETYGIQVFPTLLLFRNGKVSDVRFGGGDKESMSSWVDETLAKPVANDVAPGDYKTYAAAKLLEIKKKQAEAIGKTIENVARKGSYLHSSLKIIGGVALAVSDPGALAVSLGSVIAGEGVLNILRNPIENKPPTPARTALRTAFDIARLAGGIVLITAGAGYATIGLGIVFAGVATLSLAGKAYGFYKGGNQDAGNAPPEIPECKDGVCAVPAKTGGAPESKP